MAANSSTHPNRSTRVLSGYWKPAQDTLRRYHNFLAVSTHGVLRTRQGHKTWDRLYRRYLNRPDLMTAALGKTKKNFYSKAKDAATEAGLDPKTADELGRCLLNKPVYPELGRAFYAKVQEELPKDALVHVEEADALIRLLLVLNTEYLEQKELDLTPAVEDGTALFAQRLVADIIRQSKCPGSSPTKISESATFHQELKSLAPSSSSLPVSPPESLRSPLQLGSSRASIASTSTSIADGLPNSRKRSPSPLTEPPAKKRSLLPNAYENKGAGSYDKIERIPDLSSPPTEPRHTGPRDPSTENRAPLPGLAGDELSSTKAPVNHPSARSVFSAMQPGQIEARAAQPPPPVSISDAVRSLGLSTGHPGHSSMSSSSGQPYPNMHLPLPHSTGSSFSGPSFSEAALSPSFPLYAGNSGSSIPGQSHGPPLSLPFGSLPFGYPPHPGFGHITQGQFFVHLASQMTSYRDTVAPTERALVARALAEALSHYLH